MAHPVILCRKAKYVTSNKNTNSRCRIGVICLFMRALHVCIFGTRVLYWFVYDRFCQLFVLHVGHTYILRSANAYHVCFAKKLITPRSCHAVSWDSNLEVCRQASCIHALTNSANTHFPLSAGLPQSFYS
jgi:hypothetical protein